MKRIFAAIIIFALAAVIMCSCGESGSKKTESKVSATESVTEEETKTTKAESSAASDASAIDLGKYEGSWVSVIDPSEAMGYDSIKLEFSSGGFVMTMTEGEMEEVSEGVCEEGGDGSLVCYCNKITTRNTSDGTVENEVVVEESEREDAKMTVEALENGHISATNYSGSTIEFEKE